MKKMILTVVIAVVALGGFSAPAQKSAAAKFDAVAETRKENAKYDKEKLRYSQRIDRMWAFLERPEFATNRVNCLEGYSLISRWCLATWWLPMKQWDWDLAARHYPRLMPLVLESDVFPPARYATFVENYSRFLCGEERYDEAIKMVKAQIARRAPKIKTPRDLTALKRILVTTYDWADRFDDALAFARELAKENPNEGVKCAIELVQSNGRDDLVKEFTAMLDDETCFTYWGASVAGRQKVYPSYVKDRAAACVLDAKKPLKTRLHAFTLFLAGDHSPRGKACLEAIRAVPKADLYKWRGIALHYVAQGAYVQGDWKRCVGLFDLMLYRGDTLALHLKKQYVTALANSGEAESAAKLCDFYATEPKVSEADRLIFKFYAAIMRGQDVSHILDGCKLPVKTQSEIVRSAGREAQTLEKPECAVRLADQYAKFFTAKPNRQINVTFSEKPIRSISDWRQIYDKLEKGLCDLPFGADVEALVTDVNTQRKIAEKGKDDNLAAQMDVTAVCDRYALHVFLRVADAGARKVEHGFASGIGTESYFAPGENQPYTCFGTDPCKGLDFVMGTAYESKTHRRLEQGKGFRSEIDFSDDDYVTHLVLDWSNFYDKLPEQKGAYYKYDSIAWAPGGAKTWGGMRGVHHASDWGHLVFNLTDAQKAEIKRELVLSAYKSWRILSIAGTTARKIDLADKWDDEVIGDKAFYAKCLKPFFDGLDADVKRVTPEMDDQTVNEVYARSLKAWKGIAHEIDALRKEYLLNEFTK